MSTLTQHNITKHVRQGRTAEPVTATQMLQGTAGAYEQMLAAEWVAAPGVESVMPRHDWAQSGMSDTYDAFKFCGDWADGRQHIYAGCACYVVKVPKDARTGAPCNITNVAFQLFGDRWLADGARVFMAFSDSAQPIRDMREILALPDATPALMAVTPDNAGSDSTANVALVPEVTQPTNPAAYIHLYLVLADYLSHRGAWVEGSATLAAWSVEVTYSREVEPDALAFNYMHGWRQALNMAMTAATGNEAAPIVNRVKSQFHRHKFPPLNLADRWMALDWAAKQAMVDGAGNLFLGAAKEEGAQGVDTTAQINVGRPSLAPAVWFDENEFVQARKSVAYFSCPRDVPAGMTLWLNVGADAFTGSGTALRILVYRDPLSSLVNTANFWNGVGAVSLPLVGMREFKNVDAGGWVGVPLNNFAATQNLVVAAAISEVAHDDVHGGNAPIDESGFVSLVGFDLRDAHISRVLTPADPDAGQHTYTPAPVLETYSAPPPAPISIIGIDVSGGMALFNGIFLADEGGTVEFESYKAPQFLTFHAVVSGDVGQLQLAPGKTAFWEVATGTNVEIVSQGPASCEVKITGHGNFSLAYSAQDGMTPPNLIGKTSGVSFCKPDAFTVEDVGEIIPDLHNIVANSGTTANFHMSGVKVFRNGVASDRHVVQWRRRRYRRTSPGDYDTVNSIAESWQTTFGAVANNIYTIPSSGLTDGSGASTYYHTRIDVQYRVVAGDKAVLCGPVSLYVTWIGEAPPP